MAFFDFLNRNRRNGQQSGNNDNTRQNGDDTREDTVRNIFNQTVKRDIENIITNGSVVNSFNKDSFHTMLPAFATLVDGMQALPVPTSKPERLTQYYQIAQLTECQFCLRQIADEFLHDDENGEFIRLSIDPTNKHKLNGTQQDVLQSEFQKFISLFDFRDKAFWYMMRFLIEGECAWENIINPKLPELGIIGVRKLQTKYYDTLINAETGERIGITFNVRAFKDHIHQVISPGYYSSVNAFGSLVNNGYTIYNSYNKDDNVVMLWPQVTYVCDSPMIEDEFVVYPLLESCKQAYYQLALLQDSAVILRVTRSPERLLFNVDTGGMPDKVAEDYIRKFGNQLKQKKVALPGANDGSGSGVPNTGLRNAYNPSTMLEAWVFGKSDANGGTTVSTVGSSAAYDQIEDIKFFTKRLFMMFGVPWTRFETPNSEHKNDDSISYEEYSFSRIILRYQRLFAKGLSRSFITHLKLRGIWDKYGLTQSDFFITFTPPVLFDMFQMQKKQEFRMATYSAYADREELSKIKAMKDILHWTDADIQENYENLNKEAILNASVQYYGGKVEQNGPNAAAAELANVELKPEKSTYERLNRTKNLVDSAEYNDFENDPDEQVVGSEELGGGDMGGEDMGGDMGPDMGGGPGDTGQESAFGMGGEEEAPPDMGEEEMA